MFREQAVAMPCRGVTSCQQLTRIVDDCTRLMSTDVGLCSNIVRRAVRYVATSYDARQPSDPEHARRASRADKLQQLAGAPAADLAIVYVLKPYECYACYDGFCRSTMKRCDCTARNDRAALVVYPSL